MTRGIRQKILSLLIGISLLFGVSPAIATADCNECPNVAMNMTSAETNVAGSHHSNMPCKMPVGTCVSICAAMVNLTLPAPQLALRAPAFTFAPASRLNVFAEGVSRRPVLPPPIFLS